jgi:hypothetical protein
MIFSRGVLLWAIFFALVWPACSSAGEKPSTAIKGTWYSENRSITFKNNGTINFKGKKYYYAVSNGGLIQLTGKRSSNAIPYQLSGGKLTLTINGKATVYTRKRRGGK